jgi:hypothetical protein
MLQRECPDCGKIIIYENNSSYYSAYRRNSVCKSCRSVRANKSSKRNNIGEKNAFWKGYKDIPFHWFSKYFLRKGKKRSGDITIEQVYNLWIKQDKKCKLSGLDIDFIRRDNGVSASIDRIDSSKEYTIDNIQLVHKDINLMKNYFNQEYFISICKMVTNNYVKAISRK